MTETPVAQQFTEIAALTISQPYASLIADGEKWVENRRWTTRYRGPIAIHAGSGTQYLTRSELFGYHTGCIVAVADLAFCVDLERLKRDVADRRLSPVLRRRGLTMQWAQRILRHEHSEGPFCWVFREVRKLDDPIPMSGKRGLWKVQHPQLESVLCSTNSERSTRRHLPSGFS